MAEPNGIASRQQYYFCLKWQAIKAAIINLYI